MNKNIVHFVLKNANKFEWSLQGMGFLRLYLPGNARLHIWDSRYRVDGVSMIHDHLQWGLSSTIVAGYLKNIIYLENGDQENPNYQFATLKPGYGCYFKHAPKPITLREMVPTMYGPGGSYSQEPNQIHCTDAEDGTVTIMQKFPSDDPDSARVFWPINGEWGSAEPRKATPEEVEDITSHSLSRWFDQ